MKKGIHPNFGPATITCTCGAVFTLSSTKPSMRVEVCSNCHPLYTGRQRLVDSEGRVQKFLRKYGETKTGRRRGKGTAAAVTTAS